MTWLDLANLLFEKSNALSPRGAHLHLDTAGWFRTWTPHQNQVADSAARHFAKYLNWPETDPEVAQQLYFRSLFALEACIESNGRSSRKPPCTTAQQKVLEGLLIDAWHLEGLEWAAKRYPIKTPAHRYTR